MSNGGSYSLFKRLLVGRPIPSSLAHHERLSRVTGLAVLGLLVTQSRRDELSETRMALVEGGACFWHLVDLLWIFLFALLYLVS